MLIDIIAGARPNFMKIAPIIHAIQKKKKSLIEYRLIHTGQHYDKNMSSNFFKQLNIPLPHVNLDVGSGSQAVQTSKIMVKYEELLLQKPSNLCLVVGDVNSTMACAITARKLYIPVAHVEGGIRSGDWSMPEEINRVVTDSITNYFFTTSKFANENLKHAGIKNSSIFFVGNTMIDTLLKNLDRLKKPPIWDTLNLQVGEYFVLTMHRPINVDEKTVLLENINKILEGANGLPVLFPVHPRTAKTILDVKNLPSTLHCIDPQSYLEFNYLVKNAKAVITDSGGITEEATVLGIPCLTLRDSTERPETIEIGTNELVGSRPKSLVSHFEKIINGKWKKGGIPEKWDGKAGERIIDILVELLC